MRILSTKYLHIYELKFSRCQMLQKPKLKERHIAMKKIVSIALILVLAFATIAVANPRLATGSGPARPPAQQQSSSHSSGGGNGTAIALGIGAALLIGAIVANNSGHHSSDSSDVATIRKHAATVAQQDAQAAANLASDRGVDAAIGHVINEWDNKGCRAYSEADGSSTVVRVSGLHQDAKTAKITYTFRRQHKDVTVSVSVPDCDIVEEASAAYIEPQNNDYGNNNNRYDGYGDALQRYLGITLSGSKDSTGRPYIGAVSNGSGAYYSGIRRGAVLVAIDKHEIRSTGIDRLKSYLAQKARQQAVVRVTCRQNGKMKIADIQL